MERSALEEQTVETVLTRPDVEQALIALIDRLPKIEQSLRRLEDAVDFGMATMKDETVKEKVDAAIDNSNIQIETLESAIELIEKLPMLLQVTNQLESMFTFVQDVYHDEQTKEMIGQRIEGYAVPAKEKVEWTRDMWAEVQSRVEQDDRHITLFSLMRWIKEPSVQHGLKYVQATVDVLNERTIKR
ncbi:MULTISPECIES: hypothetical protein [Exiguobacterium]|uniref:hypothetical protein n=1 Tax=Exiguobacterium TaxID=33986 RepID=UPI00047905DE|nr:MULTISPECIES: hypothetical protein [Exiguobacterium]